MIEYRVIVDEGDTFWYKAGTYIKHREDGPAVKYANGTKFYYKNDLCHREDGPAVEYANGSREYWLNGCYYASKEAWEKAKNPPVKELTVAEISELLGYEVKVVR